MLGSTVDNMFYIRIWLLTNFAQFLRRRGLGEVFFSVLTENREGAQSTLRPSSCCAARTWILDIISTSIRGGLVVLMVVGFFAAFLQHLSGSSSELSPWVSAQALALV